MTDIEWTDATRGAPIGLCQNGDGHPGWRLFAWRPGVSGEPMCACCFRRMWTETIETVSKLLAELPEECGPERDVGAG